MHTPGTTAARPAAARNTPATAAVVLGTLSLFTSFAVVGGLVGAAGLVTGTIALRLSGRTGTGRGRALAGLLLSLAAIAASVLAAAFIAWYANHTQECYRPDGLHQYVECVRRNLSGH
ncbi:hypothetical protein [Streptacidiphilus anmyonensis]|uniref:hypothetical protein n=1 Tax=Streptacidiphilus anmyonensis TaxID=405782 RepID=UPI0005A95BD0|nr:hypothetical protein [Streptacidiphilus anmyonensis]